MTSVAILIDEMFEDSEFIYPYYRLLEAGMNVDVVGREKRAYRGKHGTSAKATKTVYEIGSGSYEGVYVPGGYAPDNLRRVPEMVAFVRAMYEEEKAVCALCHGPSLLISAGILNGKRVTAYRSIGDDLRNAGALYSDKAVEQDGNIITGRDPRSLPAVMKLFLARLQQ